MGSIPYFLAAAAVCRHQFDWRLPQVMTVSALFSRMSARMNSSFRDLLPPKARPVRSSRLM